MRHSKKIVAMLLTAICLMGILPLSASAVTTEKLIPPPYFGRNYNLVSADGITDIVKVTQDGNSEMVLEYYDSGAYSRAFSVYAISLSGQGGKEIFISPYEEHKAVTWLYFFASTVPSDYGTDISGAIGYTGDVNGTYNNYDHAFVMTTNVYDGGQLAGQFLYFSRNVTEEMLLNPYPDFWLAEGADVYSLYSLIDGRENGSYQPIDIYFYWDIYVTRFPFTGVEPTETGFPNMLALRFDEVADIVISGYSMIVDTIVSSLEQVWATNGWMTICPIVVLSGASILLIIKFILKMITKGG